MQIDQAEFDRIAAQIHSDSSPVGIDAKKTHIMIIHLLQRLDERLRHVEDQLKEIQSGQ